MNDKNWQGWGTNPEPGSPEERYEMSQWLKQLSDGLCANDRIIDGWKASRCAVLLIEPIVYYKTQSQNPIVDALHRLHEYSVNHPQHDTDEIIKSAYEFLENLNRESQRLDFLLQFLRIADVGDKDFCPGVIIQTDDMTDYLIKGAVQEKDRILKNGFESVNMRTIIDNSIEFSKS